MKSFLVRLSGTGLVVMFSCHVIVSGCTKVKRMTGITSPDDEEVAQEAKEAQGSPGQTDNDGRNRGHRRQDVCEKPQPVLFDLPG